MDTESTERRFGEKLGLWLIVPYFCCGLMQLASIYSFFNDHWGWWFFFAFLAATIVAYIPIVGTVMGITAAYKVWGWTFLSSCLLFLWPFAIYLAAFLYFLWMGIADSRRAQKRGQSGTRD
jgi:hypothetical protein